MIRMVAVAVAAVGAVHVGDWLTGGLGWTAAIAVGGTVYLVGAVWTLAQTEGGR
jgi:MFS-type transporter involved in bile tolerance (Atg22 family)